MQKAYESLLKIGEELNSQHDIDLLLERIMDYAIETLAAERGFILLKQNGKPENYEVVTARNMSRDSISAIRDHSSSIVNSVLSSGVPVITLDAQKDRRFENADSVMIQQIKSVLCTPLRRDENLIGAIYMDTRASEREFNDDSLAFLNAFAKQAAIAITNAQLLGQLQSENIRLRKQVSFQQLFPEIIGQSKAIRNVLEMIRDVADTTASVLIEGESGTGKELIARALHQHSSRRENGFIPIFCGTLSESLLESELFGHKKGAFTGATENKPGLFEEADHGTIFLDEIADISPGLQTKLLRVLQEGEIKRVGETQIRHVDVRIISATNKDLYRESVSGNFREDLYYRLNVINIKLPPLRDRRDDIPLLAGYFLKYYADKNKKNIKGFTIEAINYLQGYHWPGNIRELENAIERAVILCRQREIGSSLFSFDRQSAGVPVGQTLKEINKYAILQTIDMVNGNRTRAAKVLGVSRRWLYYQLKEWGMTNGN